MSVDVLFNQYIEQSSLNDYYFSGYSEYTDSDHTDMHQDIDGWNKSHIDEYSEEHADRHEDGELEE